MKKRALIFMLFAGILVSSSCADEILDVCTVCYEYASGDQVDEMCGGIVAVEAFESTWEDGGDYYCERQ